MNIDKCRKKKIKKSNPDNIYQNLSVIDMKKKLEGIVKNVNKLNRQELCQELYKIMSKQPTKKKIIKKTLLIKEYQNENVEKKISNTFGFINYDGSNSCYIDTTIMALFHRPSKYIKNLFIKTLVDKNDKLYTIKNSIHNELSTIYKNLHKPNQIAENNTKCSHLRSLFSNFDNQYKNLYNNVKFEQIEWIKTQQEPRDVTDMLLKIFNPLKNLKVNIVTKSGKRSEKRWFNDSLIEIGELMSNKIVYLKNYIPINSETYNLDNGSIFKKKTEIKDAKVLFINISRNFLNKEKITTPVIPEESFVISTSGKTADKIFNCVSILLHHGANTSGGHYTCVFKFYKDEKWYHYDDLQKNYKLIGDFNDMLNWNNNIVKKNMIACVYLRA